ncbi:MAG: hypothetical protein R2795_08015 [Saprospiraceae bacterium]
MSKQEELTPIEKVFRDKLNQISPEYKPGSWEQLSERMDKLDKEQIFDKKLGNSLEGLNVPYRKSSWAVLAARLELERQRIRAVVHYKAMEISLFLLLLLPILHFFPGSSIPVYDVPTPADHPVGVPIAQAPTNTAPSAIAQSKASTRATGNLLTNSKQTQLSFNAHSSISQRVVVMQSVMVTAAHSSPKRVGTETPMLEAPFGPQEQLREAIARKAEHVARPSDSFQEEGALTSLESLPQALLDYGKPEELLEYIRPLEKQTFIRVGFTGFPDYNRIITPTQELDEGIEVSLDRYALGYGGGITLGIEHGSWEIEMGALYAARRYKAVPALYISGNIRDGYTGIGLRDFILNTVTLPLNFRYNIFLQNKWRFYTQAGASLNIVLGASYYTADQDAYAEATADLNLNDSSGESVARKPEPLLNKDLVP